ncbi:MAG: ATPase, T2SS/T4P/T4SS family [Fibrobacterota bacterium]
MIILTFKDEKGKEQKLTGEGKKLFLGRSSSSGFHLPHPTVSRNHAELFESGNKITVKDLESRHGTFIGKERIKSAILNSGEEISFGGCKCKLQIVDFYSDKEKESIRELYKKVIEHLKKKEYSGSSDEKVSESINEVLLPLFLGNKKFSRMKNILLKMIIGFGPLEELLENPEISEIMVNGPDRIFIEKSGKLESSGLFFADSDQMINTIRRILSPLGRRIDESSPMADARLPDGSRINAVIPPLALCGPCLTVRKFSSKPLKIDDLLQFGSLNKEMADFLSKSVQNRKNILVSGGTGSGKTTLLNVLSSFIPGGERIVTIEDAAELNLMQEHVVALETRSPNPEGSGEVSVRDLVKNALRMRPDRIIVGECRGAEALDMLQAMNTGHDGSLTTGHANTPRDMVDRLSTMVLMSGFKIPLTAVLRQITSAIDIIIQQNRISGGKRKIVSITSIQGMEGDVISMQDLFRYEKDKGFIKSGIIN